MEEFPVAWIQIDTPVFVGQVHALCLPNPICDLIIGNIAGVHPEIIIRKFWEIHGPRRRFGINGR